MRFTAGIPWRVRLGNMQPLDTHDTARFATNAAPGDDPGRRRPVDDAPGLPVVFAGDEFGADRRGRRVQPHADAVGDRERARDRRAPRALPRPDRAAPCAPRARDRRSALAARRRRDRRLRARVGGRVGARARLDAAMSTSNCPRTAAPGAAAAVELYGDATLAVASDGARPALGRRTRLRRLVAPGRRRAVTAERAAAAELRHCARFFVDCRRRRGGRDAPVDRRRRPRVVRECHGRRAAAAGAAERLPAHRLGSPRLPRLARSAHARPRLRHRRDRRRARRASCCAPPKAPRAPARRCATSATRCSPPIRCRCSPHARPERRARTATAVGTYICTDLSCHETCASRHRSRRTRCARASTARSTARGGAPRRSSSRCSRQRGAGV